MRVIFKGGVAGRTLSINAKLQDGDDNSSFIKHNGRFTSHIAAIELLEINV